MHSPALHTVLNTVQTGFGAGWRSVPPGFRVGWGSFPSGCGGSGFVWFCGMEAHREKYQRRKKVSSEHRFLGSSFEDFWSGFVSALQDAECFWKADVFAAAYISSPRC